MRVLILLLVIMSACAKMETEKKEVAVTENLKTSADAVSAMHSSKLKNLKGIIGIEELENELKITADVSGLSPDAKLGIHIHENGICEGPDYKSAGAHFNPHNQKHGRPEGKMRHVGDMGNLITNAQGEVKQVILLPKQKPTDMKDVIGKSIIIHAKKDDLKTQPSGNSGDRIACGLIKPI